MDGKVDGGELDIIQYHRVIRVGVDTHGRMIVPNISRLHRSLT